MSQQTNPLASLSSAEAVLVGQVKAATQLVRGVGCGTLDAAMAELVRESVAAKERIESVRACMAELLGDLLATITGVSGEIRDGLSEPVVLPVGAPALALHVGDGEGEGEGDGPEPERDDAPTGKERRAARVLLMVGALFGDPTLSNRDLNGAYGGTNADAREARTRLEAAGGPVGGSEMAAAAPQKE